MAVCSSSSSSIIPHFSSEMQLLILQVGQQYKKVAYIETQLAAVLPIDVDVQFNHLRIDMLFHYVVDCISINSNINININISKTAILTKYIEIHKAIVALDDRLLKWTELYEQFLKQCLMLCTWELKEVDAQSTLNSCIGMIPQEVISVINRMYKIVLHVETTEMLRRSTTTASLSLHSEICAADTKEELDDTEEYQQLIAKYENAITKFLANIE
jgi:hypothetical protein